MFREKGFESYITKFEVKNNVEKADTFAQIKLRHSSTYETQHFLETLETKAEIGAVFHLFKHPVRWKSVKIPISPGLLVLVEFDEVEFEAIIRNIDCTQHESPGKIEFVYDITLDKVQSSEDLTLSTYLRKMEEDENGTRRLTRYWTRFNTDGSLVNKDGTQFEMKMDEESEEKDEESESDPDQNTIEFPESKD